MEDGVQWFLQQLETNQFLVGLLAASILVSVFYQLRNIPVRIWNLFLWKYTCVLTVYNTDEAFDWIDTWISLHKAEKKCRKFRVLCGHDYAKQVRSGTSPQESEKEQGRLKWCLSAGIGKHFMIKNKRPVIITKESKEDAKGNNWRMMESITIRTLGPSKKPIKNIIEESLKLSYINNDKLDVYFWDNSHWRMRQKENRDIDTIFIPKEQKDRILKHIEEWINSKEWYKKRGIPWRLGFSFEGPPGTGKTSLAMVLASHFNLPIYIASLGNISDDGSLFHMVETLPEKSILLIEDIDCINQMNTRKLDSAERNMSSELSELMSFTQSGLLNTLDGIISPEGRILIMTTNYPEKIDSAILRKSRVDHREHIGLMDKTTLIEMVCSFYNDITKSDINALKEKISERGKLVPSTVQGILINHKNNPSAAILELIQNQTEEDYEEHKKVVNI